VLLAPGFKDLKGTTVPPGPKETRGIRVFLDLELKATRVSLVRKA
jgi:hypothetical protein